MLAVGIWQEPLAVAVVACGWQEQGQTRHGRGVEGEEENEKEEMNSHKIKQPSPDRWGKTQEFEQTMVLDQKS